MLTVLRYCRPNHPGITELEVQQPPPMYCDDEFDGRLTTQQGSIAVTNTLPSPSTPVAPPSPPVATIEGMIFFCILDMQ
jgi:hypothetical protein